MHPWLPLKGTRLIAKGIINLLTKAGDNTVNIDFLAAVAPSSGNAILGRHGIHYVEAVPLTLHQVLRCISVTGRGTVNIHKDQMVAQECYSIAIKPLKEKKKNRIGGSSQKLS